MNQIKHRYTGAVLYEYESGLSIREALERATKSGSDLSGSDLRGSDLRGSNLRGSNLSGSDLRGSNLSGSNLSGSDLRGSNLRGSDLRGSDLRGSNLRGASLGELGKLIGERPFFQCGPIGSRSDYLLSFITDKGIAVKAGCFSGMLDEFRAAVEKTHGDSDHGKEYQMAILMIEAHAAIWTPKEQA